jgi:MFS transporter, DHA1 family, multidrug resistance protein
MQAQTPAQLAQARAAMPVVLMLSALLGIQPITTDLYLPVLPGLTQALAASKPQAQLTLTGLLLAFGLSQLFWGPASDRFGRKPILLWGLALYSAAAIGAAFAPHIHALIAWRVAQGAGMGAAVMAARAIVRDLYSPADGAKTLAKGLGGLGVVAVLSAPLGGVLGQLFGWRVAMLALSAYGWLAMLLIALRYTESLPQARPDALAPVALVRTWAQITRHPTFWAYCLSATLSYAGLFTFLAASPFVFIEVLKTSPLHYGVLAASMSLVYISGTFMCRSLLSRHGMQRTSWLGAWVTLAAGLWIACAGWFSWHNTWLGPFAIMLPYYLYMLGHGIHQPLGQAGATMPFPHAAGAAAAFNGFVMMCMAFCVGAWLGVSLDGTVLPLTNGIAFWSLLIALNALTLVQRHGKPPPA